MSEDRPKISLAIIGTWPEIVHSSAKKQIAGRPPSQAKERPAEAGLS
jgi:hypothetical protein